MNYGVTPESSNRSAGRLFLNILINMVLFFFLMAHTRCFTIRVGIWEDMGSGEFCEFGDGRRKAQPIYLSHSGQTCKRFVLYCGIFVKRARLECDMGYMGRFNLL